MRTLTAPVLLFIGGCGLSPLAPEAVNTRDSTSYTGDSAQFDSDDSVGGSGSGEGGSGGGRGSGGSDDDGSEGGDGGSTGPTSPQPGDIVISELMINPSAVDDQNGEWFEITNLTESRLDLSGLQISDDGVDGTTVEGTIEVAPNSYAVFCSNPAPSQNGGISCDGHYLYASTGDGFALANSSDEINVRNAAGSMLDRFTYGEGFAPVGRSIGVRRNQRTPTANDSENAWCSQSGSLPGGDQGTPGAINSNC